MKTALQFLLLFICLFYGSYTYSQNVIESLKESEKINICDSLLCVFITQNWKYVKDGDYFEFKDDKAKHTLFVHCLGIVNDTTRQPFIECMKNMTPIDFIALLGIPNERSSKALTYYLSSIREWRDPPFYCLRIIFENGKFFCTMIF